MWFFPLLYSCMLVSPRPDTMRPEEIFVDSVHIGKKHHNKVEVLEYTNGEDSAAIVIRFYARSGSRWRLKQQFHLQNHYALNFDPKIADFTHDGYADFTLISMLAARGANEVRRLYIYDPVKDRLIYMQNSEHYPNMRYNARLNCIDAWLVYGGSSTVFLRVQGNRLHEFAYVEIDDGQLTVHERDKHGQYRIIKQEKRDHGEMTRFESYKPLIIGESD